MPDPVLTATRYPNLASEGYVPDSPDTPQYNCIAWAMGDASRWWWPHSHYYWPPRCRLDNSVDAFIEMFVAMGFDECPDATVEAGYEKVALYALHDAPTHAARQLPNGEWTSKIGRYIDMRHTLRGLEGPTYGRVVRYFRRRV